ncbi:MAG: hypothetical protein IT452_13250 [Planctomycetia bacterium]|nr:hypothetical protein [Planctomycetia bacterium]
MKPLQLLLAAAALAGCSPAPRDVLHAALTHAAATPHRFSGKATRTSAPVGAEHRQVDPLVVTWEVKGEFAAPYAVVELKGLAGTRRAIGREGWWVERYEEVWRAYPSPHEAIEWIDPAAVTAAGEYGPEQTVRGVACRRVKAAHPAGVLTLDISRDGHRLMRLAGSITDGADIYQFELEFDWSGGSVADEPGARVVLEALGGAKGSGDSPEAQEALRRAWSAVGRARSVVTTVQSDFVNASEVRRRSGYLEQDPPLRAWNLAEVGRSVYIFSDGTRTVTADVPDGPVRETPGLPKPAVDDMADVDVVRASFAGDADLRGIACRVVSAELRAKSAEPGTPSSAAWIWIGPDGQLVRQLMVGKSSLAGEGVRELTTVADFTIRHEPPEDRMYLLKRARQILRR